MLRLSVPGSEFFDDSTSEFITTEPLELELEHCLAAVSKWESKFETPFLSAKEQTHPETLAYVKCMILDPKFDFDAPFELSPENLDIVNTYINSKQTATTFAKEHTQTSRTSEIVTSELIYYWMVSFNIPFECEYWNLNRLLALVKICSIKNSKPKKMSRNEIAQRNRDLNEARRAAMGTSG
jgi:hypothetical protein